MYKFFIIIIITILGFSFFTSAKGKKITKIIVDAGHGGKDFGAPGSFSNEKDITLAVALKLGKIIQDSMNSVQVIYTRTTDDYPSLVERHNIANQASADLFVSVHVNSTPYTYTRTLEGYKTVKKHHKNVRVPIYHSVRHHETTRSGVETYVLGLHRIGQQEKGIGEFDVDSTAKELLNPKDPQTAIIVAQYSQAFLKRSVKLGSKIQEQFASQGRDDLGVKQKGLEVLAGSSMPGVLVEIGFITNKSEENYLNSEKGQLEVADAIFKGIKAYKTEVEK